MLRLLTAAWLGLCLVLTPLGAHAALKPGDPAPDFTTEAALAGEPFKFELKEALKQGPVVLFFYPKAFTSGCTLEAHLFAEATPQFQALDARVIGLSHDDIDTLKRFSIEACRKQFAVASDPQAKVIRAYDAKLMLVPDMADRISYLVTPDGRIAAVHAAMDPRGHVQAMLKAVEQWKKANQR
ncbi:peroxiredoxin [Inhella gelatinilytica]|uniref:thioredoxin-dependent peroxiredoxin n=1 Tax=Inhella gelatinilytica TaxID=2795030 RepID=A0A931J1B9_9BURK|nr:peroxiredoxin [Inhella gelatinilytica]MBH9554323.1 peroxiredoxin [Inhella gelatinilytica]